MPGNLRDDMKARIEQLLKAPESDIMTITRIKIDEPEPARIHASVICEKCGERVMETRVRELNGKQFCIPCAENE
jgi:formylmethanofuran dehydrogenase subunit E